MIIKPKRLQKGDTIGIVAPSGAIKQEHLSRGIKVLENLGYKVKLSDNILAQKKYLAGSDLSRKNDLEKMFKDKDVNAIICARGGYGSTRILEKLDYKIIEENPKILCGYSDITALQLAILKKCDMTTFFAPMLVSDFGKENLNIKTVNYFSYIFNNEYKIPLVLNSKEDYTCINKGKVSGKLFIANLSVLTTIIGTNFMPDLTGYTLIIEDISEPLYKIDRMLNLLKLAGTLDKIKGLIIGEFTKTQASREDIIELVSEIIPEIPCGIGFNFSHEDFKYTCPNGIKTKFNAEDGIITIEEEFLS